MPPNYTKEELGTFQTLLSLTALEERRLRQKQARPNNPTRTDGDMNRGIDAMVGSMIERNHSLTLDKRRSGARTYYYY